VDCTKEVLNLDLKREYHTKLIQVMRISLLLLDSNSRFYRSRI